MADKAQKSFHIHQ